MLSWNSLVIIGQVAGLLILGGFGGVYLFSKSLQEKRKKENEAEDRLNKILNETVQGLEKKIKNLSDLHTENKKEIEKLSIENKLLKDIFQGRDERSVKQYKLTEDNNKSIEKLCLLLERHIALAEKALAIK